MSKVEQYFISIDDKRVNLFIYNEARRNSRVSVGRKGITIRVPRVLTAAQKQKQVGQFVDWAKDMLRKRPELYHPASTRSYHDGYSFTLRGKTYTLMFMETAPWSTANKARQSSGTIYLWLIPGITEAEKQKVIPALISKCIAKEYKGYIHNQLLYLNELYFGKVIKDFKLKYTHSVWGSCSTKGNINISTRLLFAPDDVVDYVLIHELAHMVHADHSPNFWAVVENIMPDYKVKSKWLKDNGSKCDF